MLVEGDIFMKRLCIATLSFLLSVTMTPTPAFGTTLNASDIQTVSNNSLLATSESVERETTSNDYTVSDTTYTVLVTGGSDITTAVNSALLDASQAASASEIYTVKIPAGSYIISDSLHLYSNTTLDMYGVSIAAADSMYNVSMLTLGERAYVASSACAGYGGFENVTILGGTFTAAAAQQIAPVRMSHANNVTFKDFTLGGGTSDHLLEVASINNFTVDNCTFQNMSASTESGTREAIQLDLSVHDSIYPFNYQDGTMMKNVLIQNCTFTNVSRGVGSHTQLVNAYHENIKILNNTFENVESACIIGLNYYNCEISGNTMNNCGSGIIFQFSKEKASTMFTTLQNGTAAFRADTRHDAKALIKNNIINAKYTSYVDRVFGIDISGRNITEALSNSVDGGTIPAGDYYISGVEVTGNVITTAGYGIILQDTKNCTFSDNQITGKGYSSSDKIAQGNRYNGIHFGQSSTGNKVTGNTITSVQSNGIYFQDASGASEITENKIVSPGKDGINLSADCSVTGDIAENTISKSTEHAISLSDAVVKGNIRGNKISNSTLTGINIYTSSVVSKDICDNIITNSKVNGINVGDKSKVKGNISRNTVSATTKTGIQIAGNSTVIGNVDNNTISDSTVNGISVVTSAAVDGNIESNTVKNSKKTGINIYDKSTVGGNISKNTVASSTVNGICVGNSSIVKGNIDNNVVSASKKTGIQVIQKSSVNKKIVSNTVKNSTLNGICVMTSSKVKKGIENNTISKAKKYGVYIYGKSTVKKAVAGNTISSCGTPIVVAPTCNVTIRQNTLKKNKNNYTRIITTSVKADTIKAPKFSSVTSKKKNISMKWKKIKGVSGYCVELSTTADFKKISKTLDTSSLNGEFKKLKKGKTYYVRICAYMESGKARIYSDYSKTKTIKVK